MEINYFTIINNHRIVCWAEIRFLMEILPFKYIPPDPPSSSPALLKQDLDTDNFINFLEKKIFC